MFCTVSVTRGSRSRLRGQARPSAVLSTGHPSWMSTHTGTSCTEPSARRVDTWQKFLASSSSAPRPSIVTPIRPNPFHGDVYRLHITIGARRGRALVAAEPARGAGRGDRADGREFAVVQFE